MPIWQRIMFAAARNPMRTVVAWGNNSSPNLDVYKDASMAKMSNPASLPSTIAHCTAINRVNGHVAAALESVSNTGNVLIYDTSGSQLVLVATLNVPGATAKGGLGYSPNGKYLAVTSGTSPYLYVYDVVNNYALISADTSGLNLGAPFGLAWVNERIVVGAQTAGTNRVVTYSIDSRPGYTYVTDVTLPATNQPINKLRVAPDGKKMAAIIGGGGMYYWSSIDPATYSFGTSRSTAASSPDDLHFSFDGLRLGLALTGSPFFSQWDSSSLTTWSLMSNPASLPVQRGFGVCADPNGTHFLAGGGGSGANSGKYLRYSFANVRGTDITNGGYPYFASSERIG